MKTYAVDGLFFFIKNSSEKKLKKENEIKFESKKKKKKKNCILKKALLEHTNTHTPTHLDGDSDGGESRRHDPPLVCGLHREHVGWLGVVKSFKVHNLQHGQISAGRVDPEQLQDVGVRAVGPDAVGEVGVEVGVPRLQGGEEAEPRRKGRRLLAGW